MAVQQNKKSPSRRGMRRAHLGLTAPNVVRDQKTGEVGLRHHITASGMHRGRKVLKSQGDE